MQSYLLFFRNSSLLLAATLVFSIYGCGATTRSDGQSGDATQANQRNTNIESPRTGEASDSDQGAEQNSGQSVNSAQLKDGYYPLGGTGQGLEVRGSEYRYYDEEGQQAWQPVSELSVISPELILHQDNYWCHADNAPQSGGVCTPNGWQSYDSVGTIARSELWLGGVETGSSEAEVTAQLGQPDQIDEDSPFSRRLTYSGLSISLYEDAVLNMRSVSAGYCTPSGLCPGNSTSDAQNLYGAPLVESRADADYWSYSADNACTMELEVTNETINAIAFICQV